MSVEHIMVKTKSIIWKNINLPHPNKCLTSPAFSFDGFNRYFEVCCSWREKICNTWNFEEVWQFRVLCSKKSKSSDTYIVIPYAEVGGKYIRLASTIVNTSIWRSSLSSILGSEKDTITMLFFFSPISLIQPPDVKDTAVETLRVDDSGEKAVQFLCLNGLSEDMVQLFDKRSDYADVTVKSKSKCFSVHKSILSARSEIFFKKFVGDTYEDGDGVNMEEWEADTVELFLRYLYSGKVGEMNLGAAIELYSLSEIYKVHTLRELCVSYLLCNISKDIICTVLLLADKAKDTKFLDSVASFAASNEDFLKSTDWEDFAVDNPAVAIKVYFKYLNKRPI